MKIKIFFLFFLSVVFIGCDFSKDGFRETKTGLKYTFIIQNEGAQKPELGDLMELVMTYSYNDSILFDSREYGPSIPMQLVEPLYEGDIVEGFAMLGLGDSAVFMVNADSFYYYNVGAEVLPEFIAPDSKIKFNVSLVSIKTHAQLQEEQTEYEKQRQALMRILQKEEQEYLEDYLKRHDITVEPQPSGLYFIEIEEGSGPRALPGRSVEVHYKGLLIDGSVFDSSYSRGRPISFKVGGGMVISGFEEGIAMMRQGGKAKLIVPSHIGYADVELENIPPYSTLIYEVELVKVQ